jgi:outer membrane protein TolC
MKISSDVMRRFCYWMVPFLMGVLGGAFEPVCAQPVYMLELDEALRRGLDHSAALAIAEAQSGEAAALYRGALASRHPSISTLARYTRLSHNIPDIAFSGDAIPGFDTPFTLPPV